MISRKWYFTVLTSSSNNVFPHLKISRFLDSSWLRDILTDFGRTLTRGGEHGLFPKHPIYCAAVY